MPNTLTDLAADIYTAADTVGRELTGFIPSVTQNAETTRAAKGDTVRAAFTQAATIQDIGEAMQVPEGDDVTVDNKVLTMTKARAVQIPMTGENVVSLNNGAGYDTVYGDLIAQAMRAITNEMEADIYAELKGNAGVALGANNTDLFGSDFGVIADLRAALVNAGCPDDDLSLVLGTSAGASLRKLTTLTDASASGTTQLREQGILLPMYNFNVRESGGVSLHTGGTLSAAVAAGEAVGSKAIGYDGGGTSTHAAGDVVTIQNDASGYKYVVNAGSTGSGTATGNIVLGGTGLLDSAIDGDTIVAETGTFTHNFGFHRRGVELAMRAPALPQGGDAADDAVQIQDARSGLVFEVRTYKGYRKAMIEVAAVWGVKAWKTDFIASLIHKS